MKKIILTILYLNLALTTNAQVELTGMPDVSERVNAIVRWGNTVFIGGEFTTVNGLPRLHLAAFDANSGLLLPWTPDPDDFVYSFLIVGNKLFVGGEFNNIAGVAHQNLAGFDLTNLTMLSNVPSSGSHVHDLKYYSGKVYFPDTSPGGWLVSIKRFDPVTGIIDSWATDEADLYFGCSFDFLGNFIYVGGDIFDINGNFNYDDLARFDLTTGNVDPLIYTFNNSSTWLEKVLTYNGKLYIAGSFTSINGIQRKGAAEIDANGVVTGLDFHCSNSQNYALFPQGNTMWVGGNSANIGAGMSYRLAQVQLSNGYATCWSTMGNSGSSFVCAIFVQGDTVYAGGPDQSASADPLNVFVGNPSYVSLGPDLILQPGGSLTLSPNPPFQTYQWSTGATTPTITINTPGIYWVNVISSTGCTAADTIVVTLSTSLLETASSKGIKIYPNPASDFIRIVSPIQNPKTIELFNVTGTRILENEEIQPLNDGILSISNLPAGIYFIRLKEDEEYFTGKFLKTD